MTKEFPMKCPFPSCYGDYKIYIKKLWGRHIKRRHIKHEICGIVDQHTGITCKRRFGGKHELERHRNPQKYLTKKVRFHSPSKKDSDLPVPAFIRDDIDNATKKALESPEELKAFYFLDGKCRYDYQQQSPSPNSSQTNIAPYQQLRVVETNRTGQGIGHPPFSSGDGGTDFHGNSDGDKEEEEEEQEWRENEEWEENGEGEEDGEGGEDEDKHIGLHTTPNNNLGLPVTSYCTGAPAAVITLDGGVGESAYGWGDCIDPWLLYNYPDANGDNPDCTGTCSGANLKRPSSESLSHGPEYDKRRYGAGRTNSGFTEDNGGFGHPEIFCLDVSHYIFGDLVHSNTIDVPQN